MIARDPFRFDHERLTASVDLRPEHHSEFQRLVKALRFGTRSQILILDFNDEPYRNLLIRKVDDVLAVEGLRSATIDLVQAGFATFADAEAELVRLAESADAIHVLGGDAWFDDPRWESFNIRREAIARNVPIRLLLWLTANSIRRMAELAPDLWSWRSGVLDFSTALGPSGGIVSVTREGHDHDTTLPEKAHRIAELRSILTSEPAIPDDVRAPLLDELATLLTEVGRPDDALSVRQEEVALYERLGDVRERAITLREIADILQARGDLDEALRIRRVEELPVFERLGDVRERAITFGRIADILQARGQLDEALRIRQEEQLPVFERLGDARSRAITLGHIADILEARGQLDVALRVYQEEQLPVFERLGDVRSRAVTLGRIADILQARGQLDEALRIRQQVQLPIHERLGDFVGQGAALWAIARIHLERKQIAEAIPSIERAYALVERVGRLDGICAIGAAWGQILVERGRHQEGLAVLKRCANGWRQLGRTEEAAEVNTLISQIEVAAKA